MSATLDADQICKPHPTRQAWQVLSHRVISQPSRSCSPLAELQAFLRQIDINPLDRSLAAEANAFTARVAAVLGQASEAKFLMQAARSWAALVCQGGLDLMLDIYETGVLIHCGQLDGGMHIVQRVVQDPGAARMPVVPRLHMLNDLAVALSQIGNYEGAQQTVDAGRHLLQSHPDPVYERDWDWLELTIGLNLALTQPAFERFALPASPSGPWHQALAASLLRALHKLEAEFHSVGCVQHEEQHAELLRTARSIASLCGLGVASANVGIEQRSTKSVSAQPLQLQGFYSGAERVNFWAAVEAMLMGDAQLVLDRVQRIESQPVPPSDVARRMASYLKSAAWQIRGHHRLALEQYQQHVLQVAAILPGAVQLMGLDVKRYVRPLVGLPTTASLHWPPTLAPALEHLTRTGGVGTTVAELARLCGKSDRWLRAEWQKHLNKPPLQSIVLARLDLARAKLANGWMPRGGLQQLAGDLGYSNPTRFRNAYAAAFGQSPQDTLRAGLLQASAGGSPTAH